MDNVNKKKDRDSSHDEAKLLQDATLFKLSMRDMSNVTLVLPLSGLLICFVTG